MPVSPDAPVSPVGSSSHTGRIRTALTGRGWGRLAAMLAVISGLHLLGWGTLLLVVVPERHSLGTMALSGGTFGVGVGVTAYTLGMRHAFDADHIAAIDNTTRSLVHRGHRPMSVGFWFSLGHSTVVFGLAALLAFGVRSLVGPVARDDSDLHHYTGLIGATVSGTFLLLIAIVNFVALKGIWRVFRSTRTGEVDETELEGLLASRGLANRFFGRLTRPITKPWHIYPVGVLFGLGFDTATEVALLVLAGSSAVVGLPWYAILCLPILFAAGMSLLDTADGVLMSVAYEWALIRPERKLFYNLTITALSVVFALLIGLVQIISLLSVQLGLTGGVWGWLDGLDLNVIGFVIAGVFGAVWLAAMLIWQVGRRE